MCSHGDIRNHASNRTNLLMSLTEWIYLAWKSNFAYWLINIVDILINGFHITDSSRWSWHCMKLMQRVKGHSQEFEGVNNYFHCTPKTLTSTCACSWKNSKKKYGKGNHRQKWLNNYTSQQIALSRWICAWDMEVHWTNQNHKIVLPSRTRSIFYSVVSNYLQQTFNNNRLTLLFWGKWASIGAFPKFHLDGPVEYNLYMGHGKGQLEKLMAESYRKVFAHCAQKWELKMFHYMVTAFQDICLCKVGL